MKADSPGSMGVTADPNKVRPGMIYVDLSSRRNKRQIYEAYVNGASLIFTPFNISDPELPVIKVRSTRDMLYMLIDRYFGKHEHNVKLVGVLGDGDRTVLVEMIQSILFRKDDINRLNNWSKGSLGNLYNIDEFFESFPDICKLGMDIMPITIDINSGSIFHFANMNIDCVILTDGSFMKISSEGQSGKKAVIINNDECCKSKTTEECRDMGYITYGLNKKAVVTASSIDINEVTCFNYCVQRSFHTRSGGRVDPFEVPVLLNAMGTHNIYNALAAITCGLYYDNEIMEIKAAIEGYKAPARHFQKIYDGEFTIIDNYCKSLHDYSIAFDNMQILGYENLILIISVSQDENFSFHEEKARLITEWARILKCKEIILTSCMDDKYHIGELPLKNIRAYKKIFKENDMFFRYYHLLHRSIERGLSLIEKRGLMVLLGSDEMNTAHKLLQKQLSPIVNTKH